MPHSFSFYKTGYSFINSFSPKYKQGDTVYVQAGGRLRRGKIRASQHDKDMNFIQWQVDVPALSRYVYKQDPKCPWNQ